MIPNSGDDDTLLVEVLNVLDTVLSSPLAPPEHVAAWVARTVLRMDGPQMKLLRNVQNSAVGSQTVSVSKRLVHATNAKKKGNLAYLAYQFAAFTASFSHTSEPHEYKSCTYSVIIYMK